MSDLLRRLTAANPVPSCERSSIDEVWRKVAQLEQPRASRAKGRLPRRAGHPGRTGRTGRATLALAAVVVPVLAVLGLAISLHGARHPGSRPGSPGTGHVVSTLEPAAQRAAARALAGRAGSVVALDPRTGAIRAMYGSATRALSPPGATFDIVTAAAALDTGRDTPRSRIAGPSPLTVSGTPMRNESNQSYGPVTLTRALGYSVDTVFAQAGQSVGRPAMTEYMRRFGFYASPRPGGASGALPASGVRLGGELTLPADDRVDLGRLGAGQGGLVATSLQMAMVASAVADGGRLMSPHLERATPTLAGRVMKPSTARALAQMMREVVTQGTGTAADRRGLRIAGKTATVPGDADVWFVGFAPLNDPKIAIAVTLSGIHGGYGGTIAAPIAATVIQTLLLGEDRSRAARG